MCSSYITLRIHTSLKTTHILNTNNCNSSLSKDLLQAFERVTSFNILWGDMKRLYKRTLFWTPSLLHLGYIVLLVYHFLKHITGVKKSMIKPLISIFPTLTLERRVGRPTMEGKIWEGKLVPAYPHFTNPVPLSHTITLLPWSSMFVFLSHCFTKQKKLNIIGTGQYSGHR